MELDIQSIGKRIKKRRKELHLTQTEIKEKTGISSGNMSDIERGNRLPRLPQHWHSYLKYWIVL